MTEIRAVDWSGVPVPGAEAVDFPRAWEIARSVPPERHLHPKCSFRQTGGALLCDCDVLFKHPEVTGVPAETRVYTFTGKVAHLLAVGDSASSHARALCGFSPAWHYEWHGTGSQAEYERAAELPTCKYCAKQVAA